MPTTRPSRQRPVSANAAATTPRKTAATGLSRQLSNARPPAAGSRVQPRGRLPSATTMQPIPAASPRVKAARPADSSVHMATATHSAAARGRGTRCRTSSSASRLAATTAATAMASRVPTAASR